MSNQLFVNIKNEKIYKLVDFARRKDLESGWSTEIAYQPEESQQIYIRKVSDFFNKFVPKNCWDTASDKQKKSMKAAIGITNKADERIEIKTNLLESQREYIDLSDYVDRPDLILHREHGKPRRIAVRFGSPEFLYEVEWETGSYSLFNDAGTQCGEHQFYLDPEYL